MAPPIPVRKDRFAVWVKRAVQHAKATKGLSVPKIAEVAGIGNQTIYRWMKAEGKELPDPDTVVAFCDAIDVSPDEPFRILWPGKNESATQPEPMPMDGDLQVLMRKLVDPNVSEFEREFIRETIRQLADRPVDRSHGVVKRDRRRGIAN
ncbi:helix-turn-helix transcriptional regulator [Micromonospora sp. STR1s_6]|uniref:Helix-turn-helix transcriptional regulator n=1 Tax=Micromonospora tarensis TaxID=2806100 RepID=A0ABS1YD35_9ACTN|nr:helix-turn-helix transcriptional regulator [Micromonospora tarensis]MBM0275146.1 helix-turn-helix transcriptional regulator [Micromonospora tarensis]